MAKPLLSFRGGHWEGVSAGLRSTGDIRLGGQGVTLEFLAIEPSEYSRIGIFRDDYAASDVAALIAEMEPDFEIEPLLVPKLASRIGLRMRSDWIERNIKASIRLLDANGLSHSVGLGPVNSRDWQVRMGFIPEIAIRPVEIVGLTFFETTTDELGTPISIQVDDLMYELPLFSMGESRPSSGESLVWDLVVLDSFDGSDLYTFPISRLKAYLRPRCDQSKFVSILREALENQSRDICIYIGFNRSLPAVGSALPNISNVAPINRCGEIKPLLASQKSNTDSSEFEGQMQTSTESLLFKRWS